MDTARDEVVTSALGGTLDQDRCLDLDKVPGIEEGADVADDAVSQEEVIADAAPANVQITITETEVFIDLDILVDVEGRRLGAVGDGGGGGGVGGGAERVEPLIQGCGKKTTEFSQNHRILIKNHVAKI